MTDRRQFLGAAALLAVSSGCAGLGRKRAGRGELVNDVHSQLNETRVARIVRPDSLDGLRAAVREARSSGESISIAGGRHAMGGQQFGEGTLHVDMRGLKRILGFDAERGLIEVEAGIEWPALIEGCLRAQAGQPNAWGIAQKQTGADRLTLGGALAANIHGRGLTLKPLIAQVESFRLVDAEGEVRKCSRREESELLRLVIGGYGLFGIVTSLQLRLIRRLQLERVVEVRSVEGLPEAIEERVRSGFLYGDFQFEPDERSKTFLTRGVFACYRPVETLRAIPADQMELTDAAWVELVQLAHTDKALAFEKYASYYLATNGQLYWSDVQQLGYYPEGYHAAIDRISGLPPASEMISELYVPRRALPDFLRSAAAMLREEGANVIYGTIRWIEKDEESCLSWAREPWACVVLNLHVEHTSSGISRAKTAFRGLIDLARERGGSYYLTYHRWASREQVEACHPRMVEFLRAKQRFDPEGRFQSDWWRHHRALFADQL
jgi:FAD/FMN-containing dehydrogenase